MIDYLICTTLIDEAAIKTTKDYLNFQRIYYFNWWFIIDISQNFNWITILKVQWLKNGILLDDRFNGLDW